MGIISSLFSNDKGRADDPDPETGLTSQDRRLIKDTWELILEDATGSGIKFFMRLFEIQPKYHQSFPFKDVPYDELPQNKRFQAHCNSVIHSIGSLVSTLDDSELLKCVAEKIATNHARRSVDRQALEDVKRSLIDVFSFMDEQQLDAWNQLLDFVLDYMSDVIEEVLKEG